MLCSWILKAHLLTCGITTLATMSCYNCSRLFTAIQFERFLKRGLLQTLGLSPLCLNSNNILLLFSKFSDMWLKLFFPVGKSRTDLAIAILPTSATTASSVWWSSLPPSKAGSTFRSPPAPSTASPATHRRKGRGLLCSSGKLTTFNWWYFYA